MKKYFIQLGTMISASETSLTKIEEYRESVIIEMEKMGATDDDISLLLDTDEIIINSIRKNRSPEDVAWAILQ